MDCYLLLNINLILVIKLKEPSEYLLVKCYRLLSFTKHISKI